MSTIFTSRQFNQDTARAKKASEDGPVIITDRGRPAHVLLSIEHYQALVEPEHSIAEEIGMADADDIDFEPPRVDRLHGDVDLSEPS